MRRISCLAQAHAGDSAMPEVGFGTEPLDAVMHHTLADFGVPGGALAVTDHGKLVVAKGYGWANIAARQPVTPESLFCLASVSKVVASVAVLRLVEEGKLKLDDRMYPLLGRPRPLDGFQLDPRVRGITVRQLLLHAGGFDPKQGGDYLQTAKKIAERPVRSCPFPPIFCCDMPSAARWITRPARKSITATSVSSVERGDREGFRPVLRAICAAARLRPSEITGMERERLRPYYYPHEAHHYGPDGLKEFPGGRGPIGSAGRQLDCLGG